MQSESATQFSLDARGEELFIIYLKNIFFKDNVSIITKPKRQSLEKKADGETFEVLRKSGIDLGGFIIFKRQNKLL
ncbi:hypothetical protein [Leptospira alexanderi]|uniref:Uncharacterized protein n=1 Tax=Leptospira alexanderi serovar Manhao 3 str. L 60 TaxID=1049759 RepID=V6I8D9_9LEPT|nr:hypothetical protein [Leptospira alexanderi]EQA63304.1 hypothetical protein LEP1GSC062_4514 [Leptospira alexanderi serovar Manhao 3 str. L 60]